MHVFHPSNAAQLAARDRLLQQALRPEPLTFSIASEYPLVLAPDVANRSYCFALESDGAVLAHANLLPRTTAGRKIGLIGNVATDEHWRGRGVMREVFGHLQQEAKRLDLAALFLWSDLHEFYQKLGFQSFGCEIRFTFSRKMLCTKLRQRPSFLPAPQSRNLHLAKALLQARFPHHPTLDRSLDEHVRLLQIPMLELFVAPSTTSLAGVSAAVGGYLAMGKGFDMAGVVHEWGAPSPEYLLQGLADVLNMSQLDQIVLLSPGALQADWCQQLADVADTVENHPMALACFLDKETDAAQIVKDLQSLFIWGLDSI